MSTGNPNPAPHSCTASVLLRRHVFPPCILRDNKENKNTGFIMNPSASAFTISRGSYLSCHYVQCRHLEERPVATQGLGGSGIVDQRQSLCLAYAKLWAYPPSSDSFISHTATLGMGHVMYGHLTCETLTSKFFWAS